MTSIADKILKESNVGKYEETSSEQLADQFATRFGYGRQLVLGLDKIMKKYTPDRNNFIRLITLFNQFMIIIGLIVLITTILTASVAEMVIMLIFKLGTIITLSLYILLSGDYTRDMTYDDILYRYRRIRLDMVQQLKNKYYTDENASKLIESIKEIDKIIVDIKPFFGLFRPIMNILVPINYKAKKEIQYQQMVELLASNDLFIKAAELKSFA
jgi:hypothetical protein